MAALALFPSSAIAAQDWRESAFLSFPRAALLVVVAVQIQLPAVEAGVELVAVLADLRAAGDILAQVVLADDCSDSSEHTNGSRMCTNEHTFDDSARSRLAKKLLLRRLDPARSSDAVCMRPLAKKNDLVLDGHD